MMTVSERKHFGLTPLSLEVQPLARKMLGKRGFDSIVLIEKWKDIVGEDLSSGVFPDKISYPNGKRTDGTLHVKVAGGAFATLLEHRQKILLDRINTFLGYPAISSLRISQTTALVSLPQKEPERPQQLSKERGLELCEKLRKIDDEELKEHLYEVGKMILLKELANPDGND